MMYWVKFLVCPIDSKNGQYSRRTVLSNLIAYLQKKQRQWVQLTLPRVILGDVALVDRSMEEKVRMLQYTRRCEVAYEYETIYVRPGQQISDLTIPKTFCSFFDLGIRPGTVPDKVIVKKTPFLRVLLRRNSGISGKETIPSWYQNKSLNTVLRESISAIVAEMDQHLSIQRNEVMHTFTLPLKDSEESTVVNNQIAVQEANKNMFLARDPESDKWVYSVHDFIFEWDDKFSSMFATDPIGEQPSLMEKMMAIIRERDAISAIHVSTFENAYITYNIMS